uniref:Uncharacterized protein n=1 Tax=Panstrongylus lignarius TaxID=156445 RepID=A0A224Y594_9HEMI
MTMMELQRLITLRRLLVFMLVLAEDLGKYGIFPHLGNCTVRQDQNFQYSALVNWNLVTILAILCTFGSHVKLHHNHYH